MGIEFSKRAVIRVIMDAMAGLDSLKDIYDKVEAMEEPTQPELVEVPEFVAEWYEKNKDDLDFRIWSYCDNWINHNRKDQFFKWFDDTKNKPIETLIRMKDGYTVKKEQLYYVKVGNLVFAGWEDSFIAKFMTTDNIGWTDYAHEISTKDAAVEVARIVGGEAVPADQEPKLPQEIEVSEYLEEEAE